MAGTESKITKGRIKPKTRLITPQTVRCLPGEFVLFDLLIKTFQLDVLTFLVDLELSPIAFHQQVHMI